MIIKNNIHFKRQARMAATISIPQKNFLKTSEVAKLFNVNHSTVFFWVKKGKLKPVKTPGGNFRFGRQQIERLLEQRERKSTKDDRKETRFEGEFIVVIKTEQENAPLYNKAIITDMSRKGLGLIIEDNNGLMKELNNGEITEVTIMNYENPLFNKKTTGWVRHFEQVGEGKIALGVALT